MSLKRFLLAWRTIPLRDREVIDALVDPVHAGPPPSPQLAQALEAWPGSYYWSDEPDGRHLVLTQPARPRPRERWVLHALLFAATLFTTTLGGAIIAGAVDPGLLLHPGTWIRDWTAGLTFSLPLLAILLCHELGHYITARRYDLDVSPPYFIPAPPLVVWIGTLGAFIRLRTVLTDRRQLLDVGAAGPIAGFLVALPVLWIGLAHSAPIEATSVEGGIHGMIFWFAGAPAAQLGDSLISLLVRRLAAPGAAAVTMHPMALAGWLGMFVTALNLLPIAQLDGGHILFAALPRWQERAARAFWIGIMLLGVFWEGWLIWGVVVLVLSRGRLGHPPVLDAYRPLPPSRRRLAWASLVLFAVTFTPVPFWIRELVSIA
jgi:membrane-associated protease RseP (regulator of RpoE activity)